MVRTRLAMPARPCSARVRRPRRPGWWRRCRRRRRRKPRRRTRPCRRSSRRSSAPSGRPACRRRARSARSSALSAPSRSRPASRSRRRRCVKTLGRLDSAVRADLCHAGHLAILTAVNAVGQYLTTNVLTNLEQVTMTISEAPRPLVVRRRRARDAVGGMMGVGLLAGPANVIMQLARPGVGYGVMESRVESGRVDRHPIKRARTTFTYLAVSAQRHRGAAGGLPAGGERRARQVYSTDESPVSYNAFDPELQMWVGACMYKGVVDIYRIFVGEIDDADRRAAIPRRASRSARCCRCRARCGRPTRRRSTATGRSRWPRCTSTTPCASILWPIAAGRVRGVKLPEPCSAGWTNFNLLITTGFLPQRFRDEMRLDWDADSAAPVRPVDGRHPVGQQRAAAVHPGVPVQRDARRTWTGGSGPAARSSSQPARARSCSAIVGIRRIPEMRTDNDTWDITTSVGSTALFVAAARALEAQKPDRWSVDPYAEVFCRAVGGDWADVLDGNRRRTTS